jgi:hypothetical protein
MNDGVVLILAAVLVLVLLDVAALRWGDDSRDRSGRRNWW